MQYARSHSPLGAWGWRFGVALTLTTMTSSSLPASAQTPTKPPATRRDNVTETLHGVEITDPYRWLEDQESKETRAWIDAQNAYTVSNLASWPGRKAIERRLTELIKIDTIGVPTVRSDVYFFSKRLADQDLPVVYRRKGLHGPDEVLIDPNTMSADHNTSIELMDVRRDGKILAYGVRQGGQDEVEVRFLDADTRQDLPDRLPKARYFGGVALTPDGRGLYYGRMDADGPRVYHHAMGTDPARDTLLFGNGYDPGKIVSVEVSEDGRYLLLTVYYGSAAQKTEVYLQDIAQQGPVTPIVTDVDAKFEGTFAGDTLYLKTDWNAPNGRILAVDPNEPAREKWREVVPTSDAVIQSFAPIGGHLFVNTLRNVSSHVRVVAPDGKTTQEIALPAIGTVGGLSGQWDGKEAFFAFSSFPIPMTIYHYDTTKGTQQVWAQNKVPIQSDRFEVEQVFYPSKDGTKIPMFLVHAKGMKRDGARPTLLYGYGGFNASLTPFYSSQATQWAENGGVYAVANLRGGGEFGEAWHRAGMLGKKQNVFDDFIAAAEWLVANHITNPSKLAIEGGSNGGLLVGAALTQRPDLFQAVVCSFPLLDMLRYQKFLVAKFWVPEYGSSDDPEQFKYLYAYSPYQHVKAGVKYPATLFVTGDSDTRVAPLHARKMAALLQSATGSDRPVLLHYDTQAGHSAGKPIGKVIEDLTGEQCFLFRELGVQPKQE